MEEGFEYTKDNRLKKIVLTGPESTGKTTLSEQLAQYFKTVWVPEYAREYVKNLGRPAQYEDVVQIARKQKEQLMNNYKDAHGFVFFDTGLIITKVWFIEVFKRVPDNLEKDIRNGDIDLFLLCYPDLDWIKDPVRENQGRSRSRLFNIYKNELEEYHFSYNIVTGKGKERLRNAIQFMDMMFGKNNNVKHADQDVKR